MTNNNWELKDEEKLLPLEWKQGYNYAMEKGRDLLARKDQEHKEDEQFYYNRGYLDAKKEHKAELERIEEKHQKDLKQAIEDLDIQWEYEYKEGIKNAYSENWRQALGSIKGEIEKLHQVTEEEIILQKYPGSYVNYEYGSREDKEKDIEKHFSNEGLKKALSIIDRHINSLTTE